MMVAAGHRKMYAAGLVAAGGIIAPVIPPSIGFVLFGVAGGVSISKLFLAGIFPGLMLGVGLCFAWWWVARQENVESPPRKSLREIVWAFVDGFWALMLPAIIIVGLRFGVFTPTEAAVVVAVYALFVATCIYRELKIGELYEVFVSAALSTSVVMFLVAAALVSSWLITVSEIATQVVDLVRPFMGNQTLLMLAIMVLVVIVGTALDMAPTILILTPILMPIVKQAGIDPVYFGVLFIINNCDRPDHAAGRRRPQRRLRRVAHQHGRHHQGRLALHDRPIDRAVPDDPVSSARHRAGEMVQRLTCGRDRLHCTGITP